jgi:hypothetical protein
MWCDASTAVALLCSTRMVSDNRRCCRDLELAQNQLTGTIPLELSALTGLQ